MKSTILRGLVPTFLLSHISDDDEGDGYDSGVYNPNQDHVSHLDVVS